MHILTSEMALEYSSEDMEIEKFSSGHDPDPLPQQASAKKKLRGVSCTSPDHSATASDGPVGAVLCLGHLPELLQFMEFNLCAVWH